MSIAIHIVIVLSPSPNCNALLIGVSKSSLNKLQYLQNSAARILNGARVGDHITPVLETLHWLPVKYRVDFFILVLTYKALHGLTPQYLVSFNALHALSQFTIVSAWSLSCS